MKNFFGSIFINHDQLAESGINYPIKVEYYKLTDENTRAKENELIYGIQIIKTEYRDKIGIEQNKLEHVTNDESEINKILSLVKEHQVTPIGLEDVVTEIKMGRSEKRNGR